MDVYTFSLGWVLVVGTWVSYFPQHLKIIQNRSHAGLSFTNFFCAQLVSALSFVNYMVLEYRSTFECCGDDTSTYGCCASYLAFLQQAMILICQHLILTLYLWHFDSAFANTQEKLEHKPLGSRWKRDSRMFLGALVAETSIGVIGLLLALLVGLDSAWTTDYALGAGITASILIALHWFPQIITTYRHHALGSLSLPMLILQSGGSVLTAYNLSTHGGWEVFLPYLVVATMQGTLIGVIFYIYCVEKKDVPLLSVQTNQSDVSEVIITGALISPVEDDQGSEKIGHGGGKL